MAREGLVDGSRPIPIEALEVYTLISQGKRSGFAQYINRWLSHQGIAAANLTADNLLALVGLVAAGRGISVLPKLCVQRFAREQRLEIFETTLHLPTTCYYALHHGGGSTWSSSLTVNGWPRKLLW